MELLEGVMAFAVVMIILSTIVTGIAEALIRLFATRQQVLADAVSSFFRNEVVPRLTAQIGSAYAGKSAPEIVDALTREMVLNPLAATVEKKTEVGRYSWWRRLNHGIEKLSTYSFLQRLAKTKLGRELKDMAEAEKMEVLTDLSRTYERYVAASNEIFRKYAHVVTTCVAVLLCFGANIDAGRVFDHLMNSPDARASLVAQAETAATTNAEAVARLDELVGKLNAGQQIDGLEAEEMKTLAADVAKPLEGLIEKDQLPLGPSYYPYCEWLDRDCAAPADRNLFTWILNVLVAGALVSLGGPFWYRVFASLSSLTQSLRQMGGGGRREVIEEGAAEQPASGAALKDEDIARTFDIAAGTKVAPAATAQQEA